MRHFSSPLNRQQGAAAVLLLLVVSLAIVAAVLVGIRQISVSQDKTQALHAQTQAQMQAWRGADLLYRYFRELTVVENNKWEDLEPSLSAMITASNASEGDILDGEPAAFIRAVTTPDASVDEHYVTVDVVASSGTGGAAAARTTLRLVYLLAGPGSTGGGRGIPAVITFNRNLRLSGNIEVQAPDDQPYVVNVRGDVTTGGNSIRGIDTINADGSIEIGSGSTFNNLFANGDIKLTGSVSGEQNLSALGDICLSGGASAMGTVKANGSATANGSVGFGDLTAIGSSDNLFHTLLCRPIGNDRNGEVFAVDLRGNSSAESVKAGGTVQLNSGYIGELKGEADLIINNWGGTTEGVIKGDFYNNGNPAMNDKVTQNSGLNLHLTPLEPVLVETASFNALQFASVANYVFRMVGNDRVVTVKHVNGIPDGDYYLGDNTNVSGPKRDRLCEDKNCNGVSYPLCKGQSDWNGCFSYRRNQDQWDVNGRSMAPGIVLFEGDVKLSNGVYYNTFIATGSLQTSGNHQNYAPNYAGYSGVYESKRYAPNGICDNPVLPNTPAQFCLVDGTFKEDAASGLGNYAYMAGSEVGADYIGGNIALGASTKSHGNVLAGNEFNSGGNTEVHGYITAYAQGSQYFNSMGGSTKIVLDDLPPTFTPGAEISPGQGGGGGTPSAGTGELDRAVLVWSRYL